MMPDPRQTRRKRPRGMGDFAPPRVTPTPKAKLPAPLPVNECAAECLWPRVCLADGVCWDAVRAGHEAERTAKAHGRLGL